MHRCASVRMWMWCWAGGAITGFASGHASVTVVVAAGRSAVHMWATYVFEGHSLPFSVCPVLHDPLGHGSSTPSFGAVQLETEAEIQVCVCARACVCFCVLL